MRRRYREYSEPRRSRTGCSRNSRRRSGGSCSPHRSRGIEAYESACYTLPRTCYSES